MKKKTYTLKEAREKLTEILPWCLKIREIIISMETKLEKWEEEKIGPFAEPWFADQPVEGSYFIHLLQAHHLLRAIYREQVILRRLRPLLLDFPHQQEGKIVFLCWEEGEQDIAFWHEINEGYRQRKPLEEKGEQNYFA